MRHVSRLTNTDVLLQLDSFTDVNLGRHRTYAYFVLVANIRTDERIGSDRASWSFLRTNVARAYVYVSSVGRIKV